MKKVRLILFMVSLFCLIAAYSQREKLPPTGEILPQLNQEPQQTETERLPFQATIGKITYEIEPLFDYEINGLVVSYHHSARWWDYYHDRWQDYLNLKDICLIWGENTGSGVYRKMKFTSGSFTCYYRWPDQATGEKFKPFQFANNHLLTDNPEIAKKILTAKRGDQVFIKGFLAEYSHDQGFQRGSSTSRADQGNQSCETIFVTDFEILKPGNQVWRIIFTTSWWLLIGVIVWQLLNFFCYLFCRYQAS